MSHRQRVAAVLRCHGIVAVAVACALGISLQAARRLIAEHRTAPTSARPTPAEPVEAPRPTHHRPAAAGGAAARPGLPAALGGTHATHPTLGPHAPSVTLDRPDPPATRRPAGPFVSLGERGRSYAPRRPVLDALGIEGVER